MNTFLIIIVISIHTLQYEIFLKYPMINHIKDEHIFIWLSAYLVQFVGKSCNTWTKFLGTIEDDGTHGESSKGLVVDDVDFLGKHVEEEASAQHVGS